MITISKDFTFEASHILPNHPGKCSRLHGHSWQLTVAVTGPVDTRTGFVCDYGDLKKCVTELIIDKVDHQHLGYGSMYSASVQKAAVDVYPTSENLVVLFAQMLMPEIDKQRLTLAFVRLRETCTSAALWTPSGAAVVL